MRSYVKKMLSAVVVGVAFYGCAVAQSPSGSTAGQATPSPTVAQPQLTCADFRHNPNGSWTPLHPVTLGGVSMGAGVAFSEGVQFGGIDLAAALNKQCPH
jgi:hypothetical protein